MSVLQWAALYQDAGEQYGIPPAVLAGLVDVETGGKPGLTSEAGAQGITQFMPGTAKGYGVDTRPGHERSQVFGAARYLRDLGFAHDPAKALASYNAGPGNWKAGQGYATKVLARAKAYSGLQARPGHATATPAPGQATAPASSDRGPWALRALVGVALVGGGLTLVALGGLRVVGVAPSTAAAAALGPEALAAKKAASS